MPACHDGGVDVAGVDGGGAAFGDGFGGGPVEGAVEDALGIDDAAPQEAAGAALVVVVAEQAGFIVEDEAGE